MQQAEGDAHTVVDSGAVDLALQVTECSRLAIGGDALYEVVDSLEHDVNRVDGELAAHVSGCLMDNDEEVELKIAHWNSGSGDTLELDVDYYELFLPRA